MAFQGLFQKSAFQNNAFQTDNLHLLGGGADVKRKKREHYTFIPAWQLHKSLSSVESKLAEENASKERIAAELKLAEAKASEKEHLLAKQELSLINELLRLEALAQDKINQLIIQKAELLRRIRDDEDALILLLSGPFIH